MAFTQLSIVVDSGGGATATIIIPIPSATGDPNPQLALAQAIAKIGFWDASTSNFYPPAAVRKITPQ